LLPPESKLQALEIEPHQTPTDSADEWIGPFHLIEVLGRGSMGTVYLAEQEHPVRRQVALKVLHRGKSDLIVARFETERQALAMMNHPNIATVYHAGATDQGLPYFAMEVVRGQPITAYCNQHRLSIRQRLDLFLKVCEAISHAHQKMIIHRDLKPSNVLVVPGERPILKVIDFGVAISTDGPLVDPARVEGEGKLPVGTPMFMSPEQMGDGRMADARADVYALGVILYELIAGPVPFKSGTTEIMQLLVRLLEFQAPLPSERIKIGNEENRKIAAERRATLSALRRQLHGDLDRITMKAMDKERSHRYGSVSELREDISRHLRHEPIRSSPSSLWYRLGKFVRRYRTTVVTAVLIFLVLLAGLTTHVVNLRRVKAALAAEQAAGRQVQATLDYLQNILGSADAGADGYQLRVVDMLTFASKSIEQELTGQPEVEAEVRKAIGLALLELGLFEQAGSELERALAIQEEHLPDNAPATLVTRQALARQRYKQGRYLEAEAIQREVLAKQRSSFGPEHEETLWTSYNLGKMLHKLGRWQESEQLLRETLATRQRLLGADHVNTLVVKSALSLLLSDMGRPDQAAQLQRQCIAQLRRTVGERNTDSLRAMTNLVDILNQQGRFEEAEEQGRQTLSLQEEIMGVEHPEVLGTKAQIALAVQLQGRYQEAAWIYREVLDGRQSRLGMDHIDTVDSQVRLGIVLHCMGQAEEGDALVAEGMRQIDARPDHWRKARLEAELTRCAETQIRSE
jgi:non-specific serine/threonine protein kinase/serine/threonine-protein kinase